MAWWDVLLGILGAILAFILAVLAKSLYILSVQFLNFGVLWQLLPIYTSWFAVEFITKNREEQDISNRWMNSFSTIWVVFQLGNYVIANIQDPYIILKIAVLIGVATYAVFLMRLVFLRKSITAQITKIGQISSINIAVMLLVQNQVIITSLIDFVYTTLAFLFIYFILDIVITRFIEYLYNRYKLPTEAAEEKKEIKAPEIPTPRYERIIKPLPPKQAIPPPTIGKPLTPPARPATQPPITQAPPKPAIKKPEA